MFRSTTKEAMQFVDLLCNKQKYCRFIKFKKKKNLSLQEYCMCDHKMYKCTAFYEHKTTYIHMKVTF